MIARLAYLTTPGPDRFVLNIQPFGSDDIIRFEIAKAHLANILIDGAALALREYSSNRVPETKTQESANGGNRGQQPA
jgi:hypothetical protein